MDWAKGCYSQLTKEEKKLVDTIERGFLKTFDGLYVVAEALKGERGVVAKKYKRRLKTLIREVSDLYDDMDEPSS